VEDAPSIGTQLQEMYEDKGKVLYLKYKLFSTQINQGDTFFDHLLKLKDISD